jgi:hypothetical protein
MMNYGEALAYWYLRLNGFFPITNLVLHRCENLKYNGDCDILALRLPYVFEEIGGQERDWDRDLISALNNEFDRPVGLIVQVKTGDNASREDFEKSFAEDKLAYAIKRIGIVPYRDVQSIICELSSSPMIVKDNFILAKIGIPESEERVENNSKYITISLEHINSFIIERLEKYSERKDATRLFFADPLMQYFADKTLRSLILRRR